MGSSSTMKMPPFARASTTFSWEYHHPHESTTTLSLGCTKRLRPLAPKLASSQNDANNSGGGGSSSSSSAASFDLKSFIRPDSGPRNLLSFPHTHLNNHSTTHQAETQGGGTRWNPTQEQIGMLETLYRGGMRTPNAQQIEEMTKELGKYGKIEGKNVFYWFQNHKARERQKHKRNILGLTHTPRTPSNPIITVSNITLSLDTKVIKTDFSEEESTYKKSRNRCWTFECPEGKKHRDDDNGEDKTLKLFPLRPERR